MSRLRPWLDRALFFLGGAAALWFVTLDRPENTPVERNIRRLKGRQFIVVGHDPGMPEAVRTYRGPRGRAGERADDWTVFVYPTAAQAAAAAAAMRPQ